MAWPTDTELEAAGWVKISRRQRRILSTPRVRQYYWIDFPHDAYAPEFVGEHPGVVIRGGRSLHATCIIAPVTSKPQQEERYVHRLSRNPNPVGLKNGIDAYVICDHLYTVNICRLRPILDVKGKAVFPRVEQEDFEAICGLIRNALFPLDLAPSGGLQAIDEPTEVSKIEGKDGRPILRLKTPT